MNDMLEFLRSEGIDESTLAHIEAFRREYPVNAGQEYRVPAAPVSEIVDATGCGDSYHAGFLCEYARTGDVIAAMNEGSRAASRTLSHLGGFLY